MRKLYSFFLFYFLIFMPLSLTGKGHRYELAIATVFKNNAPYLKEWIEYHLLLGVQHFYLYNNSSEDDYKSVLKPYIQQGIVSLYQWPNRNEDQGTEKCAWVFSTQVPAFNHACQRAKGKAKWLAILDSDEFIVPVQDTDILSFLRRHESASIIKLFWQVYGTSGIYEIPPGHLMIELLTLKCFPDHDINRHTKVLIRPEACKEIQEPHSAVGKHHALEICVPIEEARINHYINRTVKFFLENKMRWKPFIDNVIWYDNTIQYYYHLGHDVEDRVMDRFVSPLKKRMGFTNQQ